MEILRAAVRYSASVAVRQPNGVHCSYGKLLECSEAIASGIQKALPTAKGSRDGPRIGIYAEPGLQYVAGTWSAWMCGGVAVPLAVSHPPHELDYVMRDAGISAVITSPSGHHKLKDICHAAGSSLHVVEEALFQDSQQTSSHNTDNTTASSSSSHLQPVTTNHSSSSSSSNDSGALIVYTSGTTGRPKGALHTHGFSPAAVWEQIMSGNITVLMAVPTMYSYLLSYYESNMTQQQQAAAQAAVQQLRLTVSGSAAAPVPLLQRWKALSGEQLLERYGMTETGMILSNPYEGERRPGFVGVPLPSVEVKIVQQQQQQHNNGGIRDPGADSIVDKEPSDRQGELAVRGPMLFREYWGRPEATAAAFDAQEYFLTGDTVSLEGQPPYYRILGRSSVDIIKSGGYKISALDVEGVLLHHEGVAEAAVLGVPDENLGQIVAALIYFKPAALQSASSGSPARNQPDSITLGEPEDLLKQLQQHCQAELPTYAVPRQWKLLDRPLPRNAMGKINKKQLLKESFSCSAAVAAA